MTEKEISEIRRSLSEEKNCINSVCGCYVNEVGDIIATFRKSLGLMPEEEAAKYLSIFRRTLSGVPAKNLTEISFSTKQVSEGEEYKLISKLKTSLLKDDESLNEFYSKVKSHLEIDGNYLILLAVNTYDVPYKAKDSAKVEANSDEIFSYLICSICPVKAGKSTLSYDFESKSFHSLKGEYSASFPELGFMYPAFDDRTTNIYNALYYTKDAGNNHKEFTDAVFNSEIPVPADEQKETFNDLLGKTLDDGCNIKVVRAVHEHVAQILAEHKEKRDEPSPVIDKNEIGSVLHSCGVSDEKIDGFRQKFDESFGKNAEVSPRNIVDTKKFEIKSADVVIKVKPEHTNLVTTKIIDGSKYIMIHAEGNIEVNGVLINVEEDK